MLVQCWGGSDTGLGGIVPGCRFRRRAALGQNDPYAALKMTLKAETDADAWASRPFPMPATGGIAVKVINHLGDEVMKVFKVG